jgi:biopolymer transport protein ExbD
MLPGVESTVIVAADETAPQGIVVKAMLQARVAGAEHFLIAVKRGG